MDFVYEIEIKAESPVIEKNVKYLDQAVQTYRLLERVLPSGQFKKELLQFTARKREEYVKGIFSK